MPFDKRSEQKITENIRYVSRLSRSNPETRRRYPIGGGASGQWAKVKTLISASSGDTDGHGTVTIVDPGIRTIS